MPVPHRAVVLDALHVVPHAVGVDEAGARLLGDREHPSVDVRRHPGQHRRRGAAVPFRPVLAYQVVVAPDAAAGHDGGAGAHLEVARRGAVARGAPLGVVGGEDGPACADNGTILDHEFINPVPEREGDEAGLDPGAHPADERREHSGPGAPGDVEARHRITVLHGGVPAAFSPADDGEELHALLSQPGSLLAGREVEVRLCPQSWPVILLTVEAGGPEPVLARQVERVLHTHPPLLGRVDEEESAERPPGLSAEARLRLLFEDRHALAGVDQFGRGDEAGKARPDHDRVSRARARRLRARCRHRVAPSSRGICPSNASRSPAVVLAPAVRARVVVCWAWGWGFGLG